MDDLVSLSRSFALASSGCAILGLESVLIAVVKFDFEHFRCRVCKAALQFQGKVLLWTIVGVSDAEVASDSGHIHKAGIVAEFEGDHCFVPIVGASC